jgi:hypothetical protein
VPAGANDFVAECLPIGEINLSWLHQLILALWFFLGILAVFIDERKIKYVFLTGAITALMLSWGKTSYIDRLFYRLHTNV